MSCSQTLAGLARDCASNMGGIKRVLLANKSDITAVTITSEKVTAITMAASAKFKEYALRPGTSSMNSTWQVSAENGVQFVQTDLVMVFNRMETAKRVEIMAIAQADIVAIVEDMNGKYWILGEPGEPLLLSAGDGNTGTARTDRNGYSITMTENDATLPYEVDESIIAGLL